MKLPETAHTSQPWRIHEIASDFRLEDVWGPPQHGGPEDFPRVVEMMAEFDPAKSSSRALRALFDLRWKIGGLLGWDDEKAGVGKRVPTLRDRLPADLREGPAGPEFEATPFTPLYLTENEFAAEVANETMHGILHLGRVPEGDGFRVQMAVLVKPNGLFGSLYMLAIKPFRYLIVYPILMREIGQEWQARSRRPTVAHA